METSTNSFWNTWAGGISGLMEYLQRYMVYPVPDKNVKDRILGDNSIPSNIKKTLIIDNCIKELVVQKRKTFK